MNPSELSPVGIFESFARGEGDAAPIPTSEVYVPDILAGLGNKTAELVQYAVSEQVEIVISDLSKSTPAEILEQLNALSTTTMALGRGVLRLYPLLGEMLLHIQNTEIYREMGFSSFNDFCERHMTGRLGVSKPLYVRAVAIKRSFPSLMPEEWEKFGINNLMDLRKMGDETQPTVRKAMEELRVQAQNPDRQVFVAAVKEKLSEAGIEQGRRTVAITCTAEGASRWEEFCRDPRVQSYCGSEIPGYILGRMMDECSAEWLGVRREKPEAANVSREAVRGDALSAKMDAIGEAFGLAEEEGF